MPDRRPWGDDDEELEQPVVVNVVPQEEAGVTDIRCAMPGCGHILIGVGPSHYESSLMDKVGDACYNPTEIVYFCASESDVRARAAIIYKQLATKLASLPTSDPRTNLYKRRLLRLPRLVADAKNRRGCYHRMKKLEQVVKDHTFGDEWNEQDCEKYGQSVLRDLELLSIIDKRQSQERLASEMAKVRRLRGLR